MHPVRRRCQQDQGCCDQPTKQRNDVPACPNNADMTFADDLASVRGDDGSDAHATKNQSLPEDRMYSAHEEGQSASCGEVFVHAGEAAEIEGSDA